MAVHEQLLPMALKISRTISTQLNGFNGLLSFTNRYINRMGTEMLLDLTGTVKSVIENSPVQCDLAAFYPAQ